MTRNLSLQSSLHVHRFRCGLAHEIMIQKFAVPAQTPVPQTDAAGMVLRLDDKDASWADDDMVDVAGTEAEAVEHVELLWQS